jgi:hypothetical protein
MPLFGIQPTILFGNIFYNFTNDRLFACAFFMDQYAPRSVTVTNALNMCLFCMIGKRRRKREAEVRLKEGDVLVTRKGGA